MKNLNLCRKNNLKEIYCERHNGMYEIINECDKSLRQFSREGGRGYFSNNFIYIFQLLLLIASHFINHLPFSFCLITEEFFIKINKSMRMLWIAFKRPFIFDRRLHVSRTTEAHRKNFFLCIYYYLLKNSREEQQQNVAQLLLIIIFSPIITMSMAKISEICLCRHDGRCQNIYVCMHIINNREINVCTHIYIYFPFHSQCEVIYTKFKDLCIN